MAEERRLVTILFSDVAGSTALGEELDPEDLRALLGRYYAIAKEVVAEHGGTLEKFIGDAVMAVFGLPTAHGDDAVRAIAAAEQLRDRVRAEPRLGDQLPILIGLNTGEVVATRDASSGDFLITGDAVNTAARLQQLADPWAIVCGERTASAAAGHFAFGPTVELTAKGKRAPLKALPLVGRAAVRARVQMPLFGRAGDLAQLELAASRVLDDKRPFLVSVIAPAGTGKSRLLEEFLDHLATRAPDARVAIAQCLPYGQRLTYWPLRAVLYRLVGVGDDAAPAAVREAIASWLAANDAPDRERVAPLLAATVGAGEQEALDRAALFGAWRTFIEVAARAQPLVIVFEDLHWSSDSLLDLVEFVMQPRGSTAVLMIALTRPELLDRRTTWGGGKRNHLALSLEPLGDGAVAQLVEHLLESRQPEVVERIVARAEGNPFYAGELVRALMERGGSIDSLPDTVQATVLARLDGLAEDERRLIQIGSVFGRSFRPSGVEAIASDLAGRGDAICEALMDKDLVRPSGADSFVFRHILIREVAYQTLPRATRAKLHAAAAAWIETRAAGREDAVAELIAFHYREAASLVSAANADDPETSAIKRHAVRWLVRAADVAFAGAANVEAARHLRAAIELAEPADLVGLYERLGDVFADAGGSIDGYRAALERTDDRTDPDRSLRLIGGILGSLTRSAGAVANRPTDVEMDALRARGAALLDHATQPLAIARFHMAEGFHAFWVAGDRVPTDAEVAESEGHATEALAIARSLGDIALQSAALDGVSAGAMQRGDWAACRETARSRIALGERLDLAEKMDTYSVIAWASVALGDLDEAVRISREGLGLIQPGQVPAWALHLVAWRLYAFALRGDWDEVPALAERARELWIESGKISAGYALRGLIAARDVAMARQNDPLSERLTTVIFGIVDQFTPSAGTTAQVEALRFKPGAIVDVLRIAVTRRRNPEGFERLVSAAADRDEPMPIDAIEAVRESFRPSNLRHVLVGLDRAMALARRDPALLRQVLADYEAMHARPLIGRVRCELGRMTGDDTQIEAGLRILRELGDQLQTAKFEG